MRCKTVFLCGVTAVALAGATAFGPAFAQTQNAPATQSAPADQAAPDQSSTAASTDATTSGTAAVHHARHHARTASTESGSERNTTKELNEQQLAQAQAGGPVAQNAQPAQSTDVAEAGSGAAPSETGGQAGAGQAGTAYAQPPGKTMADNAPAGAQSGNASSEAQSTASSTPSSAVPVSQVQNAKQTLASASLKNTGGQQIGTVQKIMSDTKGAPTKVQVKLDESKGMGPRSVWIDANQLQYQPQDNSVITNLSPEQLNSM